MLKPCTLWAVLVSTTLGTSGGAIRQARGADGSAPATFEADPGWEGFRNRLLPAELPITRK